MKPITMDTSRLGAALVASAPANPPKAFVRAVTAMVTHENGVAVHHDEGDIVEVYADHVDELVALGAAVRIEDATISP